MAGTLSGGSALDEELRRSNVVRLRGLPFSATEADIRDFFKGLDLGPDGVVIQINMQGRPTGQAYVQFVDAEQANKALERNRQHIGSRYVEVFKGHPADMQPSPAGAIGQGMGGGPMGMGGMGMGMGAGGIGMGGSGMGIAGTGIPGMAGNPDMRFTGVVRMRGMPYSCTPADITAFFRGMQIATDGIFLCTHADGRPTGEAFVEFVNDETATRAMQLHREPMGSRYVELFRSTKGEMMTAVQQKMYGMYAMGGMYGMGGMGGGMGGMGGFGGMGGVNVAAMQQPQQQPPGGGGYMPGGMTGVAGGDPSGENCCIKMRGLPYHAGQREIIDFFEGYQIRPGGILICMGPNERPTGEAYVEFLTPEEAARAMERHRQNIGSRYIELFRATKSEMLMAMTGGMSGFNMAAMGDPNMMLLLQQQQMAAMQMLGSQGGAGWTPEMQQAAMQYYQQQASPQGGVGSKGGGSATYSYDRTR